MSPLAATIAHLEAELAVKQLTVDALMEGFRAVVFPTVAGVTFDVFYEQAAELERLGGDWYDAFVLRDGRIAFSLGDVCGRGLGSAVKMAQAKQAFKVAASLPGNDPDPLAVIAQANDVIFLNDNDVQLTTAIYGVVDTVLRTITYASAGHHPPVLARAGELPRVLPNHGFPLGVEAVMPDLVRRHVVTYEPGTLLVFYTDGLIEFNHDLEDGETRLLAAASGAIGSPNPARSIADHVLTEAPLHPDDVAVLTLWLE